MINNLQQPILEACIESLEEAKHAEMAGAHRLELCSHIHLDGLTPPTELVEMVLKEIKIPVRIMIRPRAGNFVYDNSEFNVMLQQIKKFRNLNVDGFVFGVLTEKNEPDYTRTKVLMESCQDKPVVFHRALDFCKHPLIAIPKLLELDISGILTSGGAKTAIEGIPVLKKMLEIAPREIIVAGKVSQTNLKMLHNQLNARQYHGTKVV